jgi:hypothetical protein
MAYNNYYGNPYFQQPNFYNNNGASPDMLNQMKNQYQPQMVQQPIQQQMPQANFQPPIPTPQNHDNGVIWVQGEAGAKAFLVQANNTVTLWDSENPTIYVKTADANGVPSMRILDFTERVGNMPPKAVEHHCKCGDNSALKDDLKAVQGEIQDILSRLSYVEEKCNKISAKPTPKTTKTTKTEV